LAAVFRNAHAENKTDGLFLDAQYAERKNLAKLNNAHVEKKTMEFAATARAEMRTCG